MALPLVMTVNGERKVYFNECANDLWIRDVVFPGKRGGYFVEAGAAGGVDCSSCFQLERFLGWRGICVEPHPEFFATLTKHRPGSRHENVCLAAEDGVVEYVPAGEGDSPYCSGVRDVLIDLKESGGAVAEGASAVRMPALSLASILRKHNAPAVIDYAAFDIEGSEWEALRLFPFEEFRFLAISCEVSGENNARLRHLLANNGYVETTNPLNRDHPWELYWLHESIAPR